ncbi:MAG TPA: phosphatase PAP2 family protein [Cyclobacteriaceae bacterium]|nr:phosphatase PAP2 family protein [Cyclobacteriaceae bacterium]
MNTIAPGKIILTFSLIFLLIVLLYPFRSAENQNSFITAAQNNRSPVSVKVFQFISSTSSVVTYGLALLIYVTGAGKLKHSKRPLEVFLFIIASTVIAGLLSLLVKDTLHALRPYEVDKHIAKLSEGGGFSFPSGHSAEAFALATSMFLVLTQRWVAGLILLWSATVAWSRIYLGVHYPLDVIAGIAIGAFTSWCAYYFVTTHHIHIFNNKLLKDD